MLMEVRGQGLVDADDNDKAPQDDKLVYVIHPNAPVDEILQGV